MRIGPSVGMSVMAALLLTATISAAQTGSDMAALERKVADAQTALARVEPTGNYRELKDLEDDLAYLRVKARRGETVTARERRDLGDRLDRFTTRMTGTNTNTSYGSNNSNNSNNSNGSNASNGARDRGTRGGTSIASLRSIPSGSEMDVRLVTPLTSDTAKVEDAVEATTMVDLYRGDELIVPSGSRLTGYVSSVDRASRTDRKGALTINFTRLIVNGRSTDAKASVIKALESEGIKGELPQIGAGAGVGAIIGGILGGAKGAIAGILIGGGGVMVATEGKDIHLPEGTVLRVRFDEAVTLTR
jgi:type IV secretory pathway VirB10-like protein